MHEITINSNVKTTITLSSLLACTIMLKTACSISPLGTASAIQDETVTF